MTILLYFCVYMYYSQYYLYRVPTGKLQKVMLLFKKSYDILYQTHNISAGWKRYQRDMNGGTYHVFLKLIPQFCVHKKPQKAILSSEIGDFHQCRYFFLMIAIFEKGTFNAH